MIGSLRHTHIHSTSIAHNTHTYLLTKLPTYDLPFPFTPPLFVLFYSEFFLFFFLGTNFPCHHSHHSLITQKRDNFQNQTMAGNPHFSADSLCTFSFVSPHDYPYGVILCLIVNSTHPAPFCGVSGKSPCFFSSSPSTSIVTKFCSFCRFHPLRQQLVHFPIQTSSHSGMTSLQTGSQTVLGS